MVKQLQWRNDCYSPLSSAGSGREDGSVDLGASARAVGDSQSSGLKPNYQQLQSQFSNGMHTLVTV